MPKVALLNQTGTQVGDIELADAVFGIEPNEAVVYDAIVMQQASRRQGTHDTKGRSEVRGGGRKPWKQKVLVVHAKVRSVRHNGLAVEQSSVQHHVRTLINFLKGSSSRTSFSTFFESR